MTAALRTESSMGSRKTMRTMDTKITSLTTKLETGLHQLIFKAKCNPLTSANNNGQSKAEGELVKDGGHKRRNTEEDWASILDLLPRTRNKSSPTPLVNRPKMANNSSRSIFNRTETSNETVVMDEAETTKNNKEFDCPKVLEDRWLKCTSTLTNKLANMYDELWRQGKTMAEDVANMTLSVNSIKWNMDEGFRTIIHHRIQPFISTQEAVSYGIYITI